MKSSLKYPKSAYFSWILDIPTEFTFWFWFRFRFRFRFLQEIRLLLAKKRGNAKSILFRPTAARLSHFLKPLDFNVSPHSHFRIDDNQQKSRPKSSRYRNFLPKSAIIPAKGAAEVEVSSPLSCPAPGRQSPQKDIIMLEVSSPLSCPAPGRQSPQKDIVRADSRTPITPERYRPG